MKGSRRIRIGTALASVAFLLTLAAPALGSTGPALAPLASHSQKWAYGGQVWENGTWLTSGYTYTTRAFFGWQVITTQTNTSSTVTAISGSWTAGETYYTQYCVPNCTSPSLWENLTLTTWTVILENANLTNAATVYTNGTAQKAFGILNASSATVSTLAETYKGLQGAHLLYRGFYNYTYRASDGIAFHPALGLIPINSTKGEIWNSSSTYRASGGWSELYAYDYNSTAATSSGAGNLTGAVSARGNESVTGGDHGPVALGSGTTARSIELTFTGPYNVADGLYFTPAQAKLFGGINQDWNIAVKPGVAVSTSQVDVATKGGNNTASIVAASSTWSVAPTSAGNVTTGPTNVPSGQGGTVQGQPEPLPYAESSSRCLIGSCVSAAPRASGAAGPAFGLWLLPVALGGAAVGAGIALAFRRPREAVRNPIPAIPPGARGGRIPRPPNS